MELVKQSVDDSEKVVGELLKYDSQKNTIKYSADRDSELGFFDNCASVTDVESVFPESYLETIEKMCEVPMKLEILDGTNVQFGDTWVGTPGTKSFYRLVDSK